MWRDVSQSSTVCSHPCMDRISYAMCYYFPIHFSTTTGYFSLFLNFCCPVLGPSSRSFIVSHCHSNCHTSNENEVGLTRQRKTYERWIVNLEYSGYLRVYHCISIPHLLLNSRAWSRTPNWGDLWHRDKSGSLVVHLWVQYLGVGVHFFEARV